MRKGTWQNASWGTTKDIQPYVDEKFQNNILLTQTERLTINGRPVNPKYARNKNILVIGGSGSGKKRFYVKQNLMHMQSSYCVIRWMWHDAWRKWLWDKNLKYHQLQKECQTQVIMSQ